LRGTHTYARAHAHTTARSNAHTYNLGIVRKAQIEYDDAVLMNQFQCKKDKIYRQSVVKYCVMDARYLL